MHKQTHRFTHNTSAVCEITVTDFLFLERPSDAVCEGVCYNREKCSYRKDKQKQLPPPIPHPLREKNRVPFDVGNTEFPETA